MSGVTQCAKSVSQSTATRHRSAREHVDERAPGSHRVAPRVERLDLARTLAHRLAVAVAGEQDAALFVQLADGGHVERAASSSSTPSMRSRTPARPSQSAATSPASSASDSWPAGKHVGAAITATAVWRFTMKTSRPATPGGLSATVDAGASGGMVTRT
jgi:hypothetical protein